ncbi:hypothetical protein ACFU8X_14380 [Brevibacillus porteri]|uniref:hypothetical protein n=1 Tax=Brevibacillus porteri TaxID=2126350 RepID=UPI00370CD0AC
MSVKREVQQDIQLAQDGSVEAFARVIQLYERTLYGVARTYVGRDEDCADVVQVASRCPRRHSEIPAVSGSRATCRRAGILPGKERGR